MTNDVQYEEYIQCSKESEKRLVEKIRSCGILAELESRTYFPAEFNRFLSLCANNTARLERGKPDILMLTFVLNENTALYVECKTRIPKWKNTKKFTINKQQVDDYKYFEKCNNIRTLLAFEDKDCCYIDYLDNYNFGEIQPGKHGSGDYYFVYEKDMLSINDFMKNIDLRSKIAMEKKIL